MIRPRASEVARAQGVVKLDLVGGTLEVCHGPAQDGYAERRLMPADASVAPQDCPDETLLVKDLLP